MTGVREMPHLTCWGANLGPQGEQLSAMNGWTNFPLLQHGFLCLNENLLLFVENIFSVTMELCT